MWSNHFLHVKYPFSSREVTIIIVRYEWYFNLLGMCSENTQIRNFMEIRPVGTDLYHAEGQTDMKILIVGCRNFANMPQNFPYSGLTDFPHFWKWQIYFRVVFPLFVFLQVFMKQNSCSVHGTRQGRFSSRLIALVECIRLEILE